MNAPNESSREPLRRRVRAKALGALVRTAGVVPTAALGRALQPFSRAAFSLRYGQVIDANLERMLPHIRDNAPDVARRLVDRGRFQRDVADFAALQGAHWMRLARGAEPDSPRGQWIEELVILDPTIERLERVLSRGRGAIVITAHIGNWELLCARLRRRGIQGAVVGRVRSHDSSHRWLVKMREAYGVATIPQDSAPREALRVLQKGGVLGLLTDLHVKRIDGREAPFFGIPARTITAAAQLARLHRSPLVPVRCVRSAHGQGPARSFRLSVEEPLEPDGSLGKIEAVDDLLRRQNQVFERWILDTPEQWAWHQPRWRQRAHVKGPAS